MTTASTRPGAYKIWVRDNGSFSPSLVLAEPLGADALDEHGHLWVFDGGGSDLDAPYTCGLCNEPQWRAYGEPCKDARSLDELNAERSAWIREHAVGSAFFVPEGEPYAVALSRLQRQARERVPAAA